MANEEKLKQICEKRNLYTVTQTTKYGDGFLHEIIAFDATHNVVSSSNKHSDYDKAVEELIEKLTKRTR